MHIEGFNRHRPEFNRLFADLIDARSSLRGYAEPFARKVLGDAYVDNANGYLSWDLTPIFMGGSLSAVDFKGIVGDDRGAPVSKTVRVVFEKPVDPNGPLTSEQRKALFASFGEIFLNRDAEARYNFTRKVLGKPATGIVSWSSDKRGAITAAEAGRLLDMLEAIRSTGNSPCLKD